MNDGGTQGIPGGLWTTSHPGTVARKNTHFGTRTRTSARKNAHLGEGPRVGSMDGISGSYAPEADGEPDPGEVVWAWVPYEEDPSQGKDRPVLVIALADPDDSIVLALPLTSIDHDRDAAQEAAQGRYWMDVGTGDWDREHRPSEVRLNRLLRLDAGAVRREGAALDPQTYAAVVEAARAFHTF